MTNSVNFGIRINIDGKSNAIADVRQLGDEFESTGTRSIASFSKTRQGIESISTQLKNLQSDAVNLFSGAVLAGFIKQVADSAIELDKFKNVMSMASGSAKNAGLEYEYVKRVSNTLGLELRSTADAYASFSAAAKGTALEGEKSRLVFESVSKATSKLGLSAYESKGVFTALIQMMSKGVVAAEEFRGQLAERLPIATEVGARAMRVTTAEFTAMLNSGKLVAEDLLPKMAIELNKLSGEPVKGLQSSLNLLSNHFTEIKQRLSQSLPLKFTVDGAEQVLSNINAVVAALNGVGVAIAGYASVNLVQSISARVGAMTAERAATIASAEAAVQKASADLILARSNSSIYGSSLQLTAAIDAQTAAQTRLATVQSAISTTSNVLKGALGLLGGPIGAISLALGIGAAAWSLWGSRAESASEQADKAVQRARDRATKLGLTEKESLEAELSAARNRRDEPGANKESVLAAANEVARLREELDSVSLREKNQTRNAASNAAAEYAKNFTKKFASKPEKMKAELDDELEAYQKAKAALLRNGAAQTELDKLEADHAKSQAGIQKQFHEKAPAKTKEETEHDRLVKSAKSGVESVMDSTTRDKSKAEWELDYLRKHGEAAMSSSRATIDYEIANGKLSKAQLELAGYSGTAAAALQQQARALADAKDAVLEVTKAEQKNYALVSASEKMASKAEEEKKLREEEVKMLGKSADEQRRWNIEKKYRLELEKQLLEVNAKDPNADAKKAVITENIKKAKEAEMSSSDTMATASKSAVVGINSAISGYLDMVSNHADSTKRLVESAFKGMENSLVNFVKTGKLDFKALADSIISDIMRIIIQQNIMKPMASILGGGAGGGGGGSGSGGDLISAGISFVSGLFNANGNAFGQSGVHAFAQGGAFTNSIVNSATPFKFASGGGFSLGVMGEAGPEAVMPLARASGGALGVRLVGSAPTAGSTQVQTSTQVNVVVNNTASGVQVTPSQQVDQQGNVQLTLMVEQIEAGIARGVSRGGGILGQAIESTYGLNRTAGAMR